MYEVKCQSAAGRVHECYIRAASAAQAIRYALRTLPVAEGWRAIYALDMA